MFWLNCVWVSQLFSPRLDQESECSFAWVWSDDTSRLNTEFCVQHSSQCTLWQFLDVSLLSQSLTFVLSSHASGKTHFLDTFTCWQMSNITTELDSEHPCFYACMTVTGTLRIAINTHVLDAVAASISAIKHWFRWQEHVCLVLTQMDVFNKKYK